MGSVGRETYDMPSRLGNSNFITSLSGRARHGHWRDEVWNAHTVIVTGSVSGSCGPVSGSGAGVLTGSSSGSTMIVRSGSPIFMSQPLSRERHLYLQSLSLSGLLAS